MKKSFSFSRHGLCVLFYSLTFPFLTLLFGSNTCLATKIKQDPQGFQGIPWGSSLSQSKIAKVVLVDTGEHIQTYMYQKTPPTLWGINVESIKLMTLDNQFARALVRYHGENTHNMVMEYLESNFGPVQVPPGSMIRGLNQQYTWRGPKTEITVMFRGLGERGFLSVESRALAPAFFNSIVDDSF